MLKFDFIVKDLGIVSPPFFVYGFSRKMFFILYSILHLLLEILVNICFAIVC